MAACSTGRQLKNICTFVCANTGVSQWGCLQYLLNPVKILQSLAQLSVVYYSFQSIPYFSSQNCQVLRALIWLTGLVFGDAEIPHFRSLRVVWFHTDSHKKPVLIAFLTVAALGKQLRRSPQSKENYWPAD